MNVRILVVEDDANIRLGLVELLTSEGYRVDTCTRGDEVAAAVRKTSPALILLDVMLPELSGYDVCRGLRQSGVRTPILMLTAKGQELDKVVGLERGADDYVTKPFGVRELLARVSALLRRAASSTNPSESPGSAFKIGANTIDPRTFRLTRGRFTEELTARELKLLQLFIARPGEVFSRDQLLREVWGLRYWGTTRTLDQVIVSLRRKLGDHAESPRHIHTVHGVGYKLEQ